MSVRPDPDLVIAAWVLREPSALGRVKAVASPGFGLFGSGHGLPGAGRIPFSPNGGPLRAFGCMGGRPFG